MYKRHEVIVHTKEIEMVLKYLLLPIKRGMQIRNSLKYNFSSITLTMIYKTNKTQCGEEKFNRYSPILFVGM